MNRLQRCEDRTFAHILMQKATSVTSVPRVLSARLQISTHRSRASAGSFGSAIHGTMFFRKFVFLRQVHMCVNKAPVLRRGHVTSACRFNSPMAALLSHLMAPIERQRSPACL